MIRRIIAVLTVLTVSVVGTLAFHAEPAVAMRYRCVGVEGGLLCQDLDTGRMWFIEGD